MNSKQKSRLNLVKIQRVCPRGVRADPGIHQNKQEKFTKKFLVVLVVLLIGKLGFGNI